MARREREDQERTSRERTDNAQTFVAQFLAQHIQRLRKLSELQITRDLVGENSWLHKIAREFAKKTIRKKINIIIFKSLINIKLKICKYH